MKTLLLTIIIMTILSLGIKLGGEFKEKTFSSKEQLVGFVIQIILLIWEIIILLSL